ncbi:hypothetical protein LZ32DRAFT_447744 [Colletotrichum eremochloae]|nr:hypothetical protein LZ32DRAFT_447744 [Colletotrichum eremochloae]
MLPPHALAIGGVHFLTPPPPFRGHRYFSPILCTATRVLNPVPPIEARRGCGGKGAVRRVTGILLYTTNLTLRATPSEVYVSFCTLLHIIHPCVPSIVLSSLSTCGLHHTLDQPFVRSPPARLDSPSVDTIVLPSTTCEECIVSSRRHQSPFHFAGSGPLTNFCQSWPRRIISPHPPRFDTRCIQDCFALHRSRSNHTGHHETYHQDIHRHRPSA